MGNSLKKKDTQNFIIVDDEKAYMRPNDEKKSEVKDGGPDPLQGFEVKSEYSEAPMHLYGKPAGRCGETPCTRTVLPHHTEASCCEACYLDYEGMSPCRCGHFALVTV